MKKYEFLGETLETLMKKEIIIEAENDDCILFRIKEGNKWRRVGALKHNGYFMKLD